jgi:DNA repair protein RecO (recombination protein O)
VRLLSGEAIVLDVFDLHDRDRIVTFLSREQGKKKGVAQGARTKHSRFGGQLQLLARAQVTWFEKEGRDLARISAVEMVRPAGKLLEDLDGILTASYLADHLLEFVQEDEPGELWFRLLDSTTEALLAGVDRDLAARYFEAWVLRLSGIFPPPNDCPLCGSSFPGGKAVLPSGSDALVCFDCAGGVAGGRLVVGPETVDFLRRLGRESLRTLVERPPRPAALRQAEELAARVRRHFLQRELRSYDVMRDVMQEDHRDPCRPSKS